MALVLKLFGSLFLVGGLFCTPTYSVSGWLAAILGAILFVGGELCDQIEELRDALSRKPAAEPPVPKPDRPVE